VGSAQIYRSPPLSPRSPVLPLSTRMCMPCVCPVLFARAPGPLFASLSRLLCVCSIKKDGQPTRDRHCSQHTTCSVVLPLLLLLLLLLLLSRWLVRRVVSLLSVQSAADLSGDDGSWGKCQYDKSKATAHIDSYAFVVPTCNDSCTNQNITLVTHSDTHTHRAVHRMHPRG
jgi:hypothetical protein